MDITILLGLVAGWLVLTAAISLYGLLARDQKLRRELDRLRSERQSEQVQIAKRVADLDSRDGFLRERETTFENLTVERTKGFPWLAGALAEFRELQQRRVADRLESKMQPARKAAAAVREAARRARESDRRSKILEYQIKYYESLFPWLEDYKELDAKDLDDLAALPAVDESADSGRDPASSWISPDEFARLPSAERNQRALDHYLKSRKAKWQVGRDYERYVGFVLEKQGYRVEYRGALDGFKDLGRDLIATRSGEVLVVQCKRWAAEKIIHEKHIFQLFGSSLEYQLHIEDEASGQLRLDAEILPGAIVRPVFYTSAALSDTARKMANRLSVRVEERFQPQTYPLIKCNISERTGERIYHLPFDQQYDRTVVHAGSGDKYVATPQEAEALGFRRAWRWRGTAEA